MPPIPQMKQAQLAPPAPPKNTSAVEEFSKPLTTTGCRILIYGTGGIGKTTFASAAPGTVAFYDFDYSLHRLGLDNPVKYVKSYTEFRESLHRRFPDHIRTIAIDHAGAIEELCCKHVLQTVKTEKGATAMSLEDYGWGKDVRLVYEAFTVLLGDLEQHFLQGRNIVLLAHECKPEEKNPLGQDYTRFEPRLRSSKKGDNSIRLRVKEWCDVVGWLSYDISIDKDKKAKGGFTRTLYTTESPAYMAKSRTPTEPFPVTLENMKEVWDSLLKNNQSSQGHVASA